MKLEDVITRSSAIKFLKKLYDVGTDTPSGILQQIGYTKQEKGGLSASGYKWFQKLLDAKLIQIKGIGKGYIKIVSLTPKGVRFVQKLLEAEEVLQ